MTERYRYILVKQGLKVGSIAQPMSRRSKEFAYWLVDQVPEGATIADVLMAMADDVYNSELDKKNLSTAA